MSPRFFIANSRHSAQATILPTPSTVISLKGILTRQALDAFTQGINSAISDPSAKLIILQIDSAGSAMGNGPQFAKLISRACDIRHVEARIDGLAIGDAFTALLYCRRITATHSSFVGNDANNMFAAEQAKRLGMITEVV